MLALAWISPVSGGAPANRIITDAGGRQIVPGGYVVLEKLPYKPDDYRRMVSMGANFQVIRMPVGTIGAWPGTEPDEKVLAHYDQLVRMGRDTGLRTVFKLAFYGTHPFGDKQWDMLWNDDGGTNDRIMRGWTLIWNRYKDEPSVFGYDLLNEPQRGLDKDYDKVQREKMIPLLRRLTDRMHEISPEKWALYQPLLRPGGDPRNKGKGPTVAMEEPFGRDRVIYAPHLYQMDMSVVETILDDFQRQAAISNAPLLLGEWGSPTLSDTDGNPAEEARFTKVYRETVKRMDARGIGGIKAWFCGQRKLIPTKSGKGMTWAIFSDKSAIGRVERKYITDVVARPRPLVVAGTIVSYGNDFAAPHFEMKIEADPKLGATEIFVSAERYFPSGFQLRFDDGLVLACDGRESSLRAVRALSEEDRRQAELVHWDEARQSVTIDRWTGPARQLTLRISPEKS